jgi:hypothetical protein
MGAKINWPRVGLTSERPELDQSGKADVGFGPFYNHFSTKSELFEAAVADVLEELGGCSTGSAWTSWTPPRPSPSRSG